MPCLPCFRLTLWSALNVSMLLRIGLCVQRAVEILKCNASNLLSYYIDMSALMELILWYFFVLRGWPNAHISCTCGGVTHIWNHACGRMTSSIHMYIRSKKYHNIEESSVAFMCLHIHIDDIFPPTAKQIYNMCNQAQLGSHKTTKPWSQYSVTLTHEVNTE